MRIKTEQEFIEEYGEDWRNRISWTTSTSMDYLFGLTLTKKQEEELKSRKRTSSGSWLIYGNMVIDEPLNILDEPQIILNQDN